MPDPAKRSVDGVPALSTGASGCPLGAGARVATDEVVARAPEFESVRRIRFVLYDERARRAHVEALDDALEALA